MPGRKRKRTPRWLKLGRGNGAAIGFRQRHSELEHRRTELLERLARMEAEVPAAQTQRNRALTLLHQTFRKASVAQRPAILAAASWCIDLIEMLSTLAMTL